MEKRDSRYKLVGELLEIKGIKNFNAIFKFIPKSIVAKDMKMSHKRFVKLVENRDFSFEELKKLAELFDYDFTKFIDLY